MLACEFHSSKSIAKGTAMLCKARDAGYIDDREYDLILLFLNERCATQNSFGEALFVTYASVLTHARKLQYVRRPWYELEYSDVLAMVNEYKFGGKRILAPDGQVVKTREMYARNTLNTTLKKIRVFLCWLSTRGDLDVLESEIRKIQVPTYQPRELKADDLYTERQIAIIVEHSSFELKALWWMLYETGCRPSECADIRWGDIEWRNKSAVVTIRDTKCSQTRRAFVSMHTLAYLLEWRNSYPGTPEGESFVFLNELGEHLSYRSMSARWDRSITAVNAAGVKMDNKGLYSIRKSRISGLFRQGVSAAAIIDQHWKNKKTAMVETYSNFNSDDAVAELEVLHGIRDKSAQQQPLAPNYCPVCKTLNPAGNRYCAGCGNPLRAESAAVAEKVQTVLAANPQLMNLFEEEFARMQIKPTSDKSR